MRIPILAVTLAAAAAVVALPMTANAVAPATAPDSAVAFSDSLVDIEVLANDQSLTANAGKILSIASTSQAIDTLHGSVTCTDAGTCTYRPDLGWVGTEKFKYTVTDGTETSRGTVSVRTIAVGVIGIDSARVLQWPSRLKVTGFVKDPSGSFVQDVDVRLMAKGADDVYRQVGDTLNTGTTGKMSMTGLRPRQTTVYKWMLEDRSSKERQVLVAPSLSMTWTVGPRAVGDTTSIGVTTAPVTEGGTTLLERRLRDGTWRQVSTHTFSSTADHSFSFPLTYQNGTRIYRVRVPEFGNRVEATAGDAILKGYRAAVVDFDPTNADEWVEIANTGRTAFDLDNWVVADDDAVKLPHHTVRVGETVKVHSGAGRNTLRSIYLNRSARFWEAGSGFTLTDNHGHQVFTALQ